jgi:hypothetical protein
MFLDCQKMQNTLRNFILEMDYFAYKTLETELDFFEHRALQLEWVKTNFSMAVPRISVERVKATAVVIMAVLMRYPMLFSVEGSLQTQVREQIQSCS